MIFKTIKFVNKIQNAYSDEYLKLYFNTKKKLFKYIYSNNTAGDVCDKFPYPNATENFIKFDDASPLTSNGGKKNINIYIHNNNVV